MNNRLSDIRRRLAAHDEGLSSKAEEDFRAHAPDDIAWLLARCEKMEAALKLAEAVCREVDAWEPCDTDPKYICSCSVCVTRDSMNAWRARETLKDE